MTAHGRPVPCVGDGIDAVAALASVPMPDGRKTLERLTRAWSLLIVLQLAERANQFNALKRSLPGVTQRSLSLILRSLERDGVVTRTIMPIRSEGVRYALTPLGLSLSERVRDLVAWMCTNSPLIAEQNYRYDRSGGAQ